MDIIRIIYSQLQQPKEENFQDNQNNEDPLNCSEDFDHPMETKEIQQTLSQREYCNQLTVLLDCRFDIDIEGS